MREQSGERRSPSAVGVCVLASRSPDVRADFRPDEVRRVGNRHSDPSGDTARPLRHPHRDRRPAQTARRRRPGRDNRVRCHRRAVARHRIPPKPAPRRDGSRARCPSREHRRSAWRPLAGDGRGSPHCSSSSAESSSPRSLAPSCMTQSTRLSSTTSVAGAVGRQQNPS